MTVSAAASAGLPELDLGGAEAAQLGAELRRPRRTGIDTRADGRLEPRRARGRAGERVAERVGGTHEAAKEVDVEAASTRRPLDERGIGRMCGVGGAPGAGRCVVGLPEGGRGRCKELVPIARLRSSGDRGDAAEARDHDVRVGRATDGLSGVAARLGLERGEPVDLCAELGGAPLPGRQSRIERRLDPVDRRLRTRGGVGEPGGDRNEPLEERRVERRSSGDARPRRTPLPPSAAAAAASSASRAAASARAASSSASSVSARRRASSSRRTASPVSPANQSSPRVAS